MRLAKARQDEIQAHYNVVLKELKANQKWQGSTKGNTN